ncbi:MAG TPA: hypothetical protein VKB93_08950 [Thermoanaerobaculia bacterium]|nr:hypothetical protein [Thermoanaerobaculia bacterium]
MSRNRGIGVVVAAVVVPLLLIHLLPFGPAVIAVREPGAIDPADVLFVVRNPFRNRAPERAAARALAAIRDGRCEQTLAFLDRENLVHVCSREREYRPIDWSLLGRKDLPDGSRVEFRVSREGYGPGTWGSLIVTVVRRQGQYVVTGYNAAY